jgi:archaellum component FlaC
MKVEQISSELASQMMSMSEVSHDETLSDHQKAQKLQAMKTATLERINSEFSSLTVISQSILDNIRTIVEREDWAKIPPPKSLSISLATASSVTQELQSIASNMLPDLQAFQRLFLEIMRDWIKNMSDADVLGQDQQWKAAQLEFDKSKASALQERTVGIATGAMGIVTAVASMAVKIGVTVKTASKAAEIGPGKDAPKKLDEANTAHQGQQAEYNKINESVIGIKTRIQEKKVELNQLEIRAADLKKSVNSSDAAELKKITADIQSKKSTITNLESNVLPAAEKDLSTATEKLKLASLNLSATTAGIESANNSLGQEVQKLRAKNDIADMANQAIQSLVKFGTSFGDYEAKVLHIDADKAAFVKNFASTVQQNARRDMQDVRDAINSLNSTFGAILQALDSAASYANRTV